MPLVTELSLFAATFIAAYTWGPGWLARLREALARARRP